MGSLKRRARISAGLVLATGLLACGQGLVATQGAPAPVATHFATATLPSIPANPTPLATFGLTGAPLAATPAPAITEARAVEIEWPLSIRVGDSDVVFLSLAPGKGGYLTPTAEIGGHATGGTSIEMPNLYDTHNVVAVARLDSVGLDIDRTGDWEQPLLPGQSLRWRWTLTPRQAGKQVATVWLHLRFVPKSGGDYLEREIWARTLTISATTVFGLSGRAAQTLGVFGSVMGGVMGFPFADRMLSWAWGRLTGEK